jgi:hypothetical protein
VHKNCEWRKEKMKAKIKKKTRITWDMREYTGGGRRALSLVGVWSEKAFFHGGHRTRLGLFNIVAETNNGKNGFITLNIRDFFGNKITKEDVRGVISKIKSCMEELRITLEFKPDEHGHFVFNVAVENGSGFVETVIRIVSRLVSTLEVRSDDWFSLGFKLEQTTYLWIGNEWVELTKSLLDKHRIYDEQKSRKMNELTVSD